MITHLKHGGMWWSVYFDPVLKNAENWEDEHGGGKQYRGFSTNVIADLTIKCSEKEILKGHS